MPAKFGVNYTITAKAARPISVESSTPLGVIGTAEGMEAGLHYFSSVTKAKEALAEKTGTLKCAINAVYAQAVETQVILSVFDKGDSDADTKSNAIKAIDGLAKADALFGCRPNVIIAPEFSFEIAGELQGMAIRLKATAIIDIDASDSADAIVKAESFGSERVVLCYPAVSVWDVDQKMNIDMPLSSYVAGMLIRTDSEWEYGFSDSYSNRVLSGISGTSVPVDFILGDDCEADQLRKAGITTVIRFDGFRLWGGETMSSDTIWKDLARVRTFDRIAEACQKGVFYAIDRKASQLFHAKRSVEELCRNLTGTQVLIGYSVNWSKEKNTTATVTEGKFYLDVEMQNNPIVKTLELEFAYVDKYSEKLLADINN